MQVLFIILNKVNYLDDILSILVKLNVKGATILDSQGMASAIVNSDIRSIPLFGALKDLLKEHHPYNKTIFTVIKDQALLYQVVEEVKALLKNDKLPCGFMFTVPVGEMFLLN
jgi:nitrogen regulatory protein PII